MFPVSGAICKEPSICCIACTYTYSHASDYYDMPPCIIIIGTSGSVQLRGGDTPQEGTVEYCTGGTWKAVCDSNWDNKEAFVVCRQLGLPATGKIIKCMVITFQYTYEFVIFLANIYSCLQ